MRALVTLFAIVSAVFYLTDVGGAYATTGRRWASGSTVTMHLHVGSSSGTLIDGSTSWNSPSESAISLWSQSLNGISFRAQRDSTSAIGNGNRVNNVLWGDDIYGEPFGAETLAVTTTWYQPSNNTFTEKDVVFNRARSWNSYRGNLRSASGGGTLQDFRRVALHEFGHVLGLDHPDEHGQSVSAIMNSRISNTDSLQSDDTNGVQSIYGTVTAAPAVTDTLRAGSRLTLSQTLVSTNRQYRLLYQADGNLVLYDDVNRTAPWATNTGGTSAGRAELQSDGNFVLYDGQNVVRFASNTPGNPNSRLVVQNDGNIVLYASNGQPVWDRNR